MHDRVAWRRTVLSPPYGVARADHLGAGADLEVDLVDIPATTSVIETAIGGRVVTTVPEGDRRTDVVVRLPQAFTANVENLRELPLSTPTGERVLLREVADFRIDEGPAQISREDGKLRATVEIVYLTGWAPAPERTSPAFAVRVNRFPEVAGPPA